MRILYIVRHNPWGIGGGCYACRCYLDAFTTVFADEQLDVCLCAEYLKDNDNLNPNLNGNLYPNVHFVKVTERSKVEKVLSPITGLLHRFDHTARRMLKSKKYDYCIFDHNSIAGPLVGLCKELGVKSVVINHNCEYEYYRDNHSKLMRTMFLRHVRNAERNSCLGCDYNIFLTEEDKDLFEHLYGHSESNSIVTGCFDTDKGAWPQAADSKSMAPKLRLVISGTIGNVQNMDGIDFFLKELLPHIPKDAEVVVAGKNPPADLASRIEMLNMQDSCAPVTLIPNPKDIMTIVCACDIFVCPTRLGGGLKLRVMDGLKAGLPVIAHQVSARGYSAFKKEGMLWSFENNEDFRTCIHEVIKKLTEGSLKKSQIQNFAAQQFSLESKVSMLKEFLTK